MKVLVIAMPGMGNTILTIPLIRTLKQNFPNIQIDLLVGLKSSKLIMEDCPYLNKIYQIDQKINKSTLSALYRLNKEKYDISFTTFPAKQTQYNVLAKIINAKRRITHNYRSNLVKLQNIRIPIKITHDIKQNLNLLKPFNLENSPSELELWPVHKKSIKKSKNFIIGIHPGSSIERGMIKKRWPPKYFSKLIGLLSEDFKDLEVRLYLGPAEKELAIIKEISKNPEKISIIDQGLKETVESISQCNLFISNDSGLMHIAAALTCKVIAIYGSTSPEFTPPLSDRATILKLDLDCQPCFKRTCPLKHHHCMRQLLPERVLKEI